ncbi:hypothetical protein Tco_0606900, partial [Tanacetum coccineum]
IGPSSLLPPILLVVLIVVVAVAVTVVGVIVVGIYKDLQKIEDGVEVLQGLVVAYFHDNLLERIRHMNWTVVYLVFQAVRVVVEDPGKPTLKGVILYAQCPHTEDVDVINPDGDINEVWKEFRWELKEADTKCKDGVYKGSSSRQETQENILLMRKKGKAKNTTAKAVPKDHLMTFHGMDDAKEIREQPSRHGLVVPKLLSQLDALGAGVSDEDANHKFLRSLPPAWDSLAMTMRTKKNIDRQYNCQ